MAEEWKLGMWYVERGTRSRCLDKGDLEFFAEGGGDLG